MVQPLSKMIFFGFQKKEVKWLKEEEEAGLEVASDPALLFLGDLCDHARERRERRGGEWAMLQVRGIDSRDKFAAIIP